ncbi:glycosyltransferase family 2 protein [uncultured Parabacteroides sp.]|uniref:glycosyltransferase family 2 protein n=1 Tax=uncultured Parabacteroides sp. TaxID=512312 RepID=UPI00262AAB7B|nr:glycosyltransferase family 2 protein [uncultured Parabacteroides sp.]
MARQVSIITINYNGLKDTGEMIEAFKAHETFPYEIIVVDNASRDPEEYAILKERHPAVRVIRSERNLGFAGGNNLGISHASGDYLLFLNNDTLIDRPVLENLVKVLDLNPRIGGVSPKIACWPDKKRLQYAGSTPMSPVCLRNESIGFGQIDKGLFDRSRETAFTHGAAMMIRTSDLKKFGKMPEFYFLYYEELDWCVQIKRAGLAIWYEATATVYHKESMSVGKQSPLQVYYHTRNRLLFAKRSIDKRDERIYSYIYQTLVAFPKRFLAYLRKGRFQLLGALSKGLINGLVAINKDMDYGKELPSY